MGAKGSTCVDSKYYDLLDVKPDASVADLQKAYKRRALRLHPDKGGDPDDFKEMKDAYDVLIDPEKRKMYDRFGPDVLGVMNGDGPPSPEAILAVIKNITKRERLTATLMVVSVASFVTSPAIMFSLRWDEDNHMNWAFTMIPLWLLETAAVFALLMRAELPSPEDVGTDMDDEGKAMYAEMKRSFRTMKLAGSTCIVLLATLQAFVTTKLQGAVDWSWIVVVSPWMLLELIVLLVNIRQARTAYPTEVNPPKFVIFLMQRVCWGLARFATAILVALRAEMITSGSWVWAITPLLLLGFVKYAWAKQLDKLPRKPRRRSSAWNEIKVGSVVSVDGLQNKPELNGQVGTASSWDEEKSRWNVEISDGRTLQLKPTNLKVIDPEAGPESPDPEEIPKGGLSTVVFCGLMLWLPWLFIAALKLDGDGLSALLIFVPFMLLVCIITCCFSCAFLCITPEVVQQAFDAQREADGHIPANMHPPDTEAGSAASAPVVVPPASAPIVIGGPAPTGAQHNLSSPLLG